jgi:chitinase
MPFYGKECSASHLYGPSPSSSWTDLEYSAVAPRLNSGWDYFWDEVSKVPYLLNTARTKFVTYEDSLSIRSKCEYVKSNGLGGVMIWALGQDVMNNTQPLLEAVGRAMQTTGITESPDLPPNTFELLGNYPNPFNGGTRIEFILNKPGTAELVITNISGAKVQTLRQNFSDTGKKAFRWEANDEHGAPVASGIYFYTIVFQEGSRSGKMLYLR